MASAILTENEEEKSSYSRGQEDFGDDGVGEEEDGEEDEEDESEDGGAPKTPKDKNLDADKIIAKNLG